MNLKPRNDYAIVRRTVRGITPSGIAVGQGSAEGVEYHVVSIGPEVTGLKVGERVLMVGTIGEDLAYIPGEKDLMVTKQANIILVYEGE